MSQDSTVELGGTAVDGAVFLIVIKLTSWLLVVIKKSCSTFSEPQYPGQIPTWMIIFHLQKYPPWFQLNIALFFISCPKLLCRLLCIVNHLWSHSRNGYTVIHKEISSRRLNPEVLTELLLSPFSGNIMEERCYNYYFIAVVPKNPSPRQRSHYIRSCSNTEQGYVYAENEHVIVAQVSISMLAVI